MDDSISEPQLPWETLIIDNDSHSFPAKASKINLKPPPLEKYTPNPIDDLCIMAAVQQKEQQTVFKNHQDLSDQIKKLNTSIEVSTEEMANLKKDLSLTSEEYKIAAKPLVKAIKKYSTNLDMQISIKKHQIEQIFVATVKFSTRPKCKAINFIIDLKQRNILDFDAESVMGQEEARKLKQQAKGEDGWDLEVVLKKLRECSI